MKSAVQAFLDNPKSKWANFRLWVSVTWPDVRDWFLRWVYAQHNARVIINFERDMSSVIYEATGGMMSKPYYTIEAMKAQINDYHNSLYQSGYLDGVEDQKLVAEKEAERLAIEEDD